MTHSVSDLTTFSRKARGDVPPPLVGASTTVIGGQMYLFGGRLVAERRMVADLYRFHFADHTWEHLPAPETDPNAPPPRYFHSADVWNGHLVVFGGMGYAPPPSPSEDFCVLSDVRLYSLADACWLPAPQTPAPAAGTSPDLDLDPALATSSGLAPRARYAHLSAISANHLYIIGGQDMTNAWLDDIHVFDLVARAWVARVPYPRHCGTYRSVAVCTPERVANPPRVFANIHDSPGDQEELVELPFTADATPKFPNNIYLYSNHNFTDVKRELQILHPTPTIPDSPFSLTDASVLLTGSSLPPGLRFPTGALLGTHLLIAGTYLAHTFQSYSLWTLDLRTYTWSRIDPGTALSHGAWGRGVVWGAGGRFVVFGNREGSLVEDYNRRLLSWGDVAYVDLEAFGVYSPPRRLFSAITPPIPAPDAVISTSGEDPAQLSALGPVILGLKTLHQQHLADFDVVVDDGRRIKCSSAVLEARWGWFKRQRHLFRKRAQQIEADLASGDAQGSRSASGDRETDDDFTEPDPRLSSRELRLSEPYAVTMALLQYLYTLTLVTPLQHAPPVLSALLLIACTYKDDGTHETEQPLTRPTITNGNGNGHSSKSSPLSSASQIGPSSRPRLPQFDSMPHLMSLVKHAMHRALSPSNSVGVYEVATLCDCQSLQIRALKVVMASNRRQVNRSRQNTPGPGMSGRPRGLSEALPPPPPSSTRPRTADGTSSYNGVNSFHHSPRTRQNPSETLNGVKPQFGPAPDHPPPAKPPSHHAYKETLELSGDSVNSHDPTPQSTNTRLRSVSFNDQPGSQQTHTGSRPEIDEPLASDENQARRASKRDQSAEEIPTRPGVETVSNNLKLDDETVHPRTQDSLAVPSSSGRPRVRSEGQNDTTLRLPIQETSRASFDSEPDLTTTEGKRKAKEALSGKNEGGSGLSWLLSSQARAERAAAKLQAKMEKREREAMNDAVRTRLKEEAAQC